MEDINPKVLYEVWLEQNKRDNPNFRDENPIQTQSDFIDMCKKEEIQIDNTTTELENHMVVGEYYDNEEGE